MANRRRVAGEDLPAADEAFERSLALWHTGAAEDPGSLNAARVLGLEASLRRAQCRLPEALALIDQALALDSWGETPALLLAKARALVEVDEFEASIALLQAVHQMDADREPRKRYLVCNLLVLNLCHAGRYAAAELLLPELGALALRLGNRLDLLRADWLAGKVAAGQGRADDCSRRASDARAPVPRRRGRRSTCPQGRVAATPTLGPRRTAEVGLGLCGSAAEPLESRRAAVSRCRLMGAVEVRRLECALRCPAIEGLLHRFLVNRQ